MPTLNVPTLNQNPNQAAWRGLARSHNAINTAGASTATGHQPNGANDKANEAPASAASR